MTREARAMVMSRVKNKDTAPEVTLRKALYAAGIRGWRCHVRRIAGTPDIAFTRWKLAVFVDGAFWHGHPSHFKAGQSGSFWDKKIEFNRRRDAEVTRHLVEDGWTVVRVWDFELSTRPNEVVQCIRTKLHELKEIHSS